MITAEEQCLRELAGKGVVEWHLSVENKVQKNMVLFTFSPSIFLLFRCVWNKTSLILCLELQEFFLTPGFAFQCVSERRHFNHRYSWTADKAKKAEEEKGI